MALIISLFTAGLLTVLLPCILPLIPIVLGASIAGRSKWRPLLTVAGMLVSFVGFTFLLIVVLNQFVELADYLRIGTFYLLLLFGLGFLTSKKSVHVVGAILGASFFLVKGWPAVAIAAILGVIAIIVAPPLANKIQQFGSNVQQKVRTDLGNESPLTAFLMGLTMGLVWVPCAGPALGFAFTLVREQPGFLSLFYLFVYGLGTAIPLLLIGYGGQYAVHSVHKLVRYSGHVKHTAGVLLIITAVALHFNWLEKAQLWVTNNTAYGTWGVDLEERLFSDRIGKALIDATIPASGHVMQLPNLPKITRAPEFEGIGPWHNSEPLKLADLKGKVVLVDFWTYSCINCIRTLPYIQGYWEKFKDKPFVLLGVHTPEFIFEKSEKNVADAISRHGLTYPVAQDNDFGTWKAFANHYWPAKYLIDAEGYIRYTHFGEGAYDETDLAIQSLLKEIGVEVSGKTEMIEEEQPRGDRSPETYLGSRSWPALQNAVGNPSDKIIAYRAPEELRLHKYALAGDWQLVDEEKQVLRSIEGEIRMHFEGGEINLVMGNENMDATTPATVDVEVDGEHVTTFIIDHYDLYPLWKGENDEHDITLYIRGEGVEGYAFTFGS